uniref:Uncharacterized protein n=1 Tax=Triticum urartu TaxID=4572 RepID=A0A8R7V190_TRIUA
MNMLIPGIYVTSQQYIICYATLAIHFVDFECPFLCPTEETLTNFHVPDFILPEFSLLEPVLTTS